MLDWLDKIIDLGTAGAGIYSLSQPVRPPETLADVLRAGRGMEEYSRAAADFQHPANIAVRENIEEMGRQQMAGLIGEIIKRNRFQKALGRRGILDPERGRSMLSRVFSEQAEKIGPRARQEASNTLLGAARGMGGAGQVYGQTLMPLTINQALSRGRQGDLIEAIGQALKGGVNLFRDDRRPSIQTGGLPSGATDLGNQMPWLLPREQTMGAL